MACFTQAYCLPNVVAFLDTNGPKILDKSSLICSGESKASLKSN